MSSPIDLRAAEDAAAVGLIAAIVAHDAHNALVPMITAADALANRRDASVATQARILSEGCWRIAGMLRKLITLGQRGLPTRVDVNGVIAELSPTLHALVRGRIQLTTQLESPLPTVMMAAGDLERALLNLVANARDASDHDGSVTVATYLHDGWVVVEVEDHGAGMDDATIARATEPFFTTKPTGTGLGLVSVTRFATDARGRLEIESAVGVGTRIRIHLPPCPDLSLP